MYRSFSLFARVDFFVDADGNLFMRSNNVVLSFSMAFLLTVSLPHVLKAAEPQTLSVEIDDSTDSSTPSEILTLSQVLAFVLKSNPELTAFSWENRAQDAAILQAQLLPNPTFSANASNFGNKNIQGYDGDVVTLEFSQLIELGDKRAARTNVAKLNKELASFDYERKRIDVLTQASQRFIDVLLAQQTLTLIQQMQVLVTQSLHTITARVQSGKVPPVDETKAKIIDASTHLELIRAQRELDAARKLLAASWGSDMPSFKTVLGHLDVINPPLPIQTLQQKLVNNPDVARWVTEIQQRHALLDIQKSKAVPDVTATFGVSRYLMPNEYAATLGFSIPLPLFDRNQGNIEEAQHRLTKAQAEQHHAQIQVETSFSHSYLTSETIYAELLTLRQEILPNAQQVYDVANEGYRLGKFGLLDVLDAQRTLFSAQKQYLTSLADYHKSNIEIEKLVNALVNQPTENYGQ